MNILLSGVNLHPISGGTFATVCSFRETFVRAGHTVNVLNFTKYGAADDGRGFLDIATSRWPIANWYHCCATAYSERIRAMVEAANLVFIHGIYVHPLLVVSQHARDRGVPYVTVPHGSLDPHSLVTHRWRKRFWLALYHDMLVMQSAAVLYATPTEMERSWARGLERHAVVVPWGIETHGDYEKEAFAARIRTRHGLRSGQRIAFFCARMAAVKRPVETMTAFLREAPEGWVMICAGPASHDFPVEKVAALCEKSQGRCIYTGPVFGADVLEYYKAADLFLLLSHSENFSHSVATAQACAVPVVVSPGVGLACYVKDCGGGFVAPGESFEDICTALRAAFQADPAQLADQGRAGRRWAERELSQAVFSKRLGAVCHSFAAKTKSECA